MLHRPPKFAGGALGFNTLVAERLIALRERRPQIRIILVQPFLGYQRRWTSVRQARAAVERWVDKAVVCCQAPGCEAFLARDRHLVDGSSCCIAWCARAKRHCLPPARVWNVAQPGEWV